MGGYSVGIAVTVNSRSSGNTSGSSSGNGSGSGSSGGTAPVPHETKVDIFNKTVVGTDDNVVSHVQLLVEKALKGERAVVQLADINEHWSEETIRKFIRLGIITGYEDHTFKPDAEMTRSEFAVIISRVFNIQGSGSPVVLTDISESWAKDEIERLASIGLITGYGDGTFRPNAPISREEMVVILSRIVNLSDVPMDDSQGQFTDLSSSYAADEIRDAAKAGIITGKGDGRFNPKNKATRAETLHIIYNVLSLNSQIKELLEQLN
ncbi:Endo-1,4-beta-xylanase A precursor [compost metagenome]